jgi:hypothetical protein
MQRAGKEVLRDHCMHSAPQSEFSDGALMDLMLIIPILLLLFGGGFGYRRYGHRGGIGIGGILLLILSDQRLRAQPGEGSTVNSPTRRGAGSTTLRARRVGHMLSDLKMNGSHFATHCSSYLKSLTGARPSAINFGLSFPF